ncbi:MAG: hypothetical protein V4616_11500 [Bacteroidota bacterium]
MKTFVSLSLLFAVLCGCSPKYYTPNSQNVPLIHKQGQTVINGAFAGSRAELQGAYGVGEHTAVQLNAGAFFPKDIDGGDGGSGQFLEGGVGYYSRVAEKFVLETYGLFGAGAVKNKFPSTVSSEPGTDGRLSANLFRYGVQPSFGFFSKYFSAAISARFAMLSYTNISGNLIYASENQQQYLSDNRNSFLIEPALTLRAGIDKIKLQLQFVHSSNVSNPSFKQDVNITTLGVSLNFN